MVTLGVFGMAAVFVAAFNPQTVMSYARRGMKSVMRAPRRTAATR
jgi:hypothetical protein